MTRTLDVDYLVVGAGAMGMAFTDALIDHSDARVALVDRRHGVGGHWLEAYPFVQLHQSSAFYGVPSTLLGGGQLQQHGPEAGLQERATQAEITAYYARAMDRMRETGRVEFFPNSEHDGDRTVVSRISGATFRVPETCRIVNAHYLAPSIPAEMPPPFGVGDGVRVVPVNDLARLEEAPSQYVVVGSGKTATDACIWLMARGVDPDAICWVRPRDPWMFNRALIQPDLAIFLGMAADLMQSAADVDVPRGPVPPAGGARHHAPHRPLGDADDGQGAHPGDVGARPAAHHRGRRTPRAHHLGRSRQARDDRRATVGIADDALVVHCAADGLKYPPLVPVWRPQDITLQPIRAGFPCFGAALAGYVEATRTDDDEKNRLCPPSNYGDSMAQWAEMNVRGTRATMSFSAEKDIKQWADGVALNPTRVTPDQPPSAALDDARERLATHTRPALERLTRWSRARARGPGKVEPPTVSGPWAVLRMNLPRDRHRWCTGDPQVSHEMVTS